MSSRRPGFADEAAAAVSRTGWRAARSSAQALPSTATPTVRWDNGSAATAPAFDPSAAALIATTASSNSLNRSCDRRAAETRTRSSAIRSSRSRDCAPGQDDEINGTSPCDAMRQSWKTPVVGGGPCSLCRSARPDHGEA